jgi:hypothetical protein
MSFLFLTLAILDTRLHPKLVYLLLPSLVFAKKHCSGLPKALGGCPSKLSENDLHFATHLITSGKADNAVQVAKSLAEITNQSLSSQTVRNRLKELGMKAVVKKK